MSIATRGGTVLRPPATRRAAGLLESIRERLPDPPAPLPRPERPALWLLGLCLVALTWIQMVRRPSDPPIWDSLFLEDGEIFLANALGQSLPEPFFTSYHGYLHTVPRAIGELAVLFPIEDAPLVMGLATTAIVSFLAIFVYLASGAWIASPLLRAVLALSFVLVPASAPDMNGSVSNISWYLLYASFWALLCPWTERRWLAASGGIVLFTTLSNPLCALLLPASALGAANAGGRRAWLVPGAAVAGIVAQLTLRDDDAYLFADSHLLDLPRAFAERVTSAFLAGDRYLGDLFGYQAGSPFAWASLAVVVLGCAAGLRWMHGRRRWLLGGSAALAVVFWCAELFTRGTGAVAPDASWLLLGSRYDYVPVMLLVTGLVVAADRRRQGGPRWRLPELAVAGFMVAIVVSNLSLDHHSAAGRSWGPALDATRAKCARMSHWGPRVVEIQTTPRRRTRKSDPWVVRIDCEQLER